VGQSKTFKTEAVVLRSIRYAEADRIVHLYSPEHGRLNAIAKGARKPKSRFGGRLEPFFRLRLVLYSGKGDLSTVTSAQTLEGYPDLRGSGTALTAAARSCDAVLRLFDTGDPNDAAYNLLCNYLSLIDSNPDRASDRGLALAFRLKLALAAGFSPELAGCARCGEVDQLTAFSGSAGGVVCASCQGDGFVFDRESHAFMVQALAKPLTDSPTAEGQIAQQVERAIGETLEHHAHVQLRAAA
jgi:DNA repair protein RecO (recombination protein O)